MIKVRYTNLMDPTSHPTLVGDGPNANDINLKDILEFHVLSEALASECLETVEIRLCETNYLLLLEELRAGTYEEGKIALEFG